MSEFAIGQRYLSQAEPELGLGVVKAMDGRSLSLMFELAETERQYARQDFPLTRVLFDKGEEIQAKDGRYMIIAEVHQHNDVMIYMGVEGDIIPETELHPSLVQTTAQGRFLSGQLDHHRWFYLRLEAGQRYSQWWQSSVQGLTGARVEPLDHQLYIAQQVADRAHPRVMLCDEVGLGKTIEAGLILNRRACRFGSEKTLILVPAALRIQWFLELRRRFGLDARLPEDYLDIALEDERIIAPLDWLEDAAAMQVLMSLGIELIVVDEIQNLPSSSPGFASLEQLAKRSPSLILLSATPAMQGLASLSEQLALLDGQFFHDPSRFQAFAEEQTQLAQLALGLHHQQLSPSQTAQLEQLTDLSHDQLLAEPGRGLDRLLDRYGTGRVLFRNLRRNIGGYPERLLNQYPCDHSGQWLAQFLQDHPGEQALVIGHSLDELQAIKDHIWDKTGHHLALMHDQQSLTELDRQAAHFADPDSQCPILLCTQIGAEGRNFQFCQHLVLLDLPDHPDMLEQRIGRLDRIGQKHDVQIHCLIQSPSQARLLHWYQQVLRIFSAPNAVAAQIHSQYAEPLALWLATGEDDSFLTKAQADSEQQLAAERHGRDLLLELSSCRQPQAQELTQAVRSTQLDPSLTDWVSRMADQLNIFQEAQSESTLRLQPVDNMLVPALPGLPEEGLVLTTDRSQALAREDWALMSPDHPLVQALFDLLNTTELGTASFCRFDTQALPAGTLLLETQFSLRLVADRSLCPDAWLAPTQLRILVDEAVSRDFSSLLPSADLEAKLKPLPTKLAQKMIRMKKPELTQMLDKVQTMARNLAEPLQTKGLQKLQQQLTERQAQLNWLASQNPMISEQEVAAGLEAQQALLLSAQHRYEPRLTAIRLLVVAPDEEQ